MSSAAVVRQKLITHMEQAVEHLKRDLAGLRTGRASVALLDGVRVDYYGTMTPLKQVANVSTPEARLITIQPWEPNLIKEIEKALANSGLGVTPSNDGKMIRVPLPPSAMTQAGVSVPSVTPKNSLTTPQPWGPIEPKPERFKPDTLEPGIRKIGG